MMRSVSAKCYMSQTCTLGSTTGASSATSQTKWCSKATSFLRMWELPIFSVRASQLTLLWRKISITKAEEFCSYLWSLLQKFPVTEELSARPHRLNNSLWTQAKWNYTLLAFLQPVPSFRLIISFKHASSFVLWPLKPELSQGSNIGTHDVKEEKSCGHFWFCMFWFYYLQVMHWKGLV